MTNQTVRPFVFLGDPVERSAKLKQLREAFVQREQKPTQAELAEEFAIPMGTIARIAADESWTSMRAAYLEHKSQEADAAGILIQAVKIDRRVITLFSDTAIVMLTQLTMAVQSIPEDRAISTKVEIINTASFALKNLADACKTVGILGLAKTLDAAGKEDNGRWNPQMLSQINLTVQNLVGKAQADTAGVQSGSDKEPVSTTVKEPKPVPPAVESKAGNP